MPKRIQMSRQRPWRAENPDAVIVARPSKWGNPNRIGDYRRIHYDFDGEPFRLSEAEARRLVVSDFRADLTAGMLSRYPTLEEIRADLAGRYLACWCPLDSACHADVLLELANPKENP